MKPFLAIIPLAILAGGWFFYQSAKSPTTPDDSNPIENVAQTGLGQTGNPLATVSEQPDETSIQPDSVSVVNVDDPTAPSIINPAPTREDIDLTTLAAVPMSDAEFKNLERRIRQDLSLIHI